MTYRIESCEGQFEPQMLYNVGVTGEQKWFPLNQDGYWDDPNSYSLGLIRRRSLMSRTEAALAITRARAINDAA
jgi:hypothetical protein